MTRARSIADIGDDVAAGGSLVTTESPSLGRRNLIINGGFDVWQRGTSQSGANDYGSADRWFNYANTHGVTYQQGTDAPDGFIYSLTTSGTPTGDYIIVQPVELPATGNAGQFYSGQTMTLSYYAKSTDATDELYTLGVFRDAVTSVSNQVIVFSSASEMHSLSTSWQRFTFTFSITASPSGTNKMLSVLIRSLGNANGNISITGVQLEVGSVATPFEHRSYGEELALCQRYFYRSQGTGAYTAHGMGANFDGDSSDVFIHYPVEMRAIPNVTFSGTVSIHRGSGTNANISNMGDAGGSKTTSFIRCDHSSILSTGDAVYCINNNDASGEISFNAEL